MRRWNSGSGSVEATAATKDELPSWVAAMHGRERVAMSKLQWTTLKAVSPEMVLAMVQKALPEKLEAPSIMCFGHYSPGETENARVYKVFLQMRHHVKCNARDFYMQLNDALLGQHEQYEKFEQCELDKRGLRTEKPTIAMIWYPTRPTTPLSDSAFAATERDWRMETWLLPLPEGSLHFRSEAERMQSMHWEERAKLEEESREDMIMDYGNESDLSQYGRESGNSILARLCHFY